MKKALLSALALLLLTGTGFAQNLPSYIPANGLVGWWPFNGNANDESGNGNNGTINGATLTADRFGNVGKAYAFNGTSNFINIPIAAPFQNNRFTISIWANLQSTTNLSAQYLISKGVDGQYGIYIAYYNSFSQFYSAIGIGSPNALSGSIQTVPQSTWHNIVFVFDGSTMKLYEGGILLDSKFHPTPASINLNNGDFYLGKHNLDCCPYFTNGKLDDLSIWNRDLSQQEITALYNATNCANDLSLTPSSLNPNSGSTASFSATTSDPNPVYRWQSDLGLGFQDLSNYGQYSGVGSNNLQVAGLQLRNHQQKFRVISSSGNCVDTSVVGSISLNDTCINVVNDTNLVTVTDTLIITITANPGLVQNTLKAYPNPTAGMLFINTGNFAAMPGYSIRISSATGQEVYNSEVNQPLLQVLLANLSPEGLFYLRLYDASGTLVTTRKIVLQ